MATKIWSIIKYFYRRFILGQRYHMSYDPAVGKDSNCTVIYRQKRDGTLILEDYYFNK